MFLGKGLPLMQSQSGSTAQVAFNPIALEFKEASSHHVFKSSVENQATHRFGAGKLSLKAPKVVTPNG
jgi:hypothetical protein